MKIGDKVKKNEDTWVPNEFDGWGRGVGTGKIVAWWHIHGEATVQWANGKYVESIEQLIDDVNANVLAEWTKLSDRERWEKAGAMTKKKLRGIVWSCMRCGTGDAKCMTGDRSNCYTKSIPENSFMGSIHCGKCSAELTRRTGGGQNNPFRWYPKPRDLCEKSGTS